MQFKPPSQPGWSSSEPDHPQQEFPQQVSSPFFQQLQPPTQPTWQEPQYPPRPETYYPPQQSMMPALPPPKKRMRRNDKIALAIIASLVGAALLIVFSVVLFSGAIPTAPSVSQINQQATSTAAAAQSDAATASAVETANANSLSSSQPIDTPTPQPSPTAQNDVGSTQTSDVWSVTLNSVKTGQGDGYLAPKAGNIYLYANLTTKNTDTANHLMSVIYFSLRDSDGNSYSIGVDSNVQDLSGSVVANQQLRGYVIFEVPKTIHSFTLQFDPSFDASQIVQWQLSV